MLKKMIVGCIQMDIILSSGFLAFASHIGFLRSIEEKKLVVEGICGTSSGALVGALWAAGLSTKEIEQELFSSPPFVHLRPNLCFWNGIFSLHQLRARMAQLLPSQPKLFFGIPLFRNLNFLEFT